MANAPTENWVNVPTNSILTIHGQSVVVQPIKDAYSSRSPYHKRSAAFVHTKGLAANEKTTINTRVATPSAAPPFETPLEPSTASQKKSFGPTIPLSLLRSRTPDSRNRTPLAAAESSTAPTTHSDFRTLTAPPLIRQGSTPSQGNIKKKRMSLGALDHTPPPAFMADPDPPTPVTPAEPPRNNYGDPNKIAQFFPELTLTQ
jgi:glutamine amidotransferase